MASVAFLLPVAAVAVVVVTVRLVVGLFCKMVLKRRGRATSSTRGKAPLYKPKRWKAEDDDFHHGSLKHRSSLIPQATSGWEMDVHDSSLDGKHVTTGVPTSSGQCIVEITEEVEPQASHDVEDTNHHSQDEELETQISPADHESLSQPELLVDELETIPTKEDDDAEVQSSTSGECSTSVSLPNDTDRFLPVIYAIKKVFADIFA